MVTDSEGAEAPSWDMLAEALEECRQLSEMADGLLEENARLRAALAETLARDAERDAELEKLRAEFTVLQRMLFGRSSEKSRLEPPCREDADGNGDAGRDRGSGRNVRRGPGARAGRRDYSHLPRFEVFWDFRAAGTAARSAGSRSRCWAITGPGSSWTGR